MQHHQLMAFVFLAVAFVDAIIGFVIVIPRVPSQNQLVMQLTFAGSFMLLAGLAAASWFQWIQL
jgi:hypothetical protein